MEAKRAAAPPDGTGVRAVWDYVKANWHRSVHRDTREVRGEILPHPYTVPCITGTFNFFFYWDTYFTNLGLLAQEEPELARFNIENMMYLIRRQGFMPNHVGLENRSQPPYFGMMVRDYYEATGDRAWLRDAAESLRQEYHFWVNARATPTGLSRHAHTATYDYLERFYATVVRRLGFPEDLPREDRRRIADRYVAEAETGWDFNPRFDGRCPDFCPVDLNANLYAYERFLGECSELLGWGEAALWEGRAARRAERMRQYLWNEERGLFLDYDFRNGRHSSTASLASFHPLWAGLATRAEAARTAAQLGLFERAHGAAVCEPVEDPRDYQWGYPNMWPPLTWTTVSGLARYGLREDSRRIAAKYLAANVALFEKTGQLWEKLDARTGDVAGGEYKAQPMLGWSAGVFIALARYLGLAPEHAGAKGGET